MFQLNVCVGQKTGKRVDNIAMNDMHSNNSSHGIMQRNMDAPVSFLFILVFNTHIK